MTYNITVTEEVAQSKILFADNKDEALKAAFKAWANFEIEFKHHECEVWNASAVICRQESPNEEKVVSLTEDMFPYDKHLKGLEDGCYRVTYIVVLQTEFRVEAKSLDEAESIFRERFKEGRFKTLRLPKLGPRATCVEGQLEIDRVHFVPEFEFVGRKDLFFWKRLK